MSAYEAFTLNNGLRVVVKPIPHSQMVHINLMYLAGARDEAHDQTGVAHYLEHVMFGGSANIADYDLTLQAAGAENNAYTSSDVTSYWVRLPVNRLELAFWVESDRMLAPSFHEEVLKTQQKVVMEEFKEGYTNPPYGDAWHHLCKSAYQVHPYQWPTIGKELGHIAAITREHVVPFYQQWYTPANAVLTIVGGVQPSIVYQLVKKWFEPIPASSRPVKALPQEPVQTAPRYTSLTGKVPQNRLYKAWHLPGRAHPDYALLGLVQYLLSEGKSSLLYRKLVEEHKLVSTIHAFTTATIDPALFVIDAKLNDHVTFSQVETALQQVLDTLAQPIAKTLLARAKNQLTAAYVSSQISAGEQADTLGFATLLGNTDFFDQELAALSAASSAAVQELVGRTFTQGHTTLYYNKAS